MGVVARRSLSVGLVAYFSALFESKNGQNYTLMYKWYQNCGTVLSIFYLHRVLFMNHGLHHEYSRQLCKAATPPRVLSLSSVGYTGLYGHCTEWSTLFSGLTGLDVLGFWLITCKSTKIEESEEVYS